MIKFFRKIRQNLLTENKFSKYLLYAIGEIVLVVIGIYIAIQLNNWNQDQQNQKLTATNIQLLIDNIEKDSIYFNQLRLDIQKDTASLNSYQRRLNKPSTTLDTLIKIARYEMNPVAVTMTLRNDDAYNTMAESGEINMMEKQLRQDIFAHYSLHNSAQTSNDMHFNTYYLRLTEFNSTYGIQRISLFKEGPIAKAIWARATLVDLANQFNPMIQAKRIHNIMLSRSVERIINESNTMLTKLREALKNDKIP